MRVGFGLVVNGETSSVATKKRVQWESTIDWGCSGMNGRNVFREGFKNAENKLDV